MTLPIIHYFGSYIGEYFMRSLPDDNVEAADDNCFDNSTSITLRGLINKLGAKLLFYTLKLPHTMQKNNYTNTISR